MYNLTFEAKYPEDIKLIKKLGVSHYRFSIEWSKIQPNKVSERSATGA